MTSQAEDRSEQREESDGKRLRQDVVWRSPEEQGGLWVSYYGHWGAPLYTPPHYLCESGASAMVWVTRSLTGGGGDDCPDTEQWPDLTHTFTVNIWLHWRTDWSLGSLVCSCYCNAIFLGGAFF